MLVLLAAPLLMAQTPALVPQDACAAAPKSVACREQKQARDTFARALKLKKAGKDEAALEAFEEAARLAPGNIEYLTARELVRQDLVYQNIRRGSDLVTANRPVEATAAFQQALNLDPENEFARQRLQETVEQFTPKSRLRIEQAAEIQVQPAPGTKDFHYRGDARGLLQAVTSAFRVKMVVDNSFIPRPVRFDLEGADFSTAMRMASRVTKSFWVPLAPDQVLVADDNPEMHRVFDRMVLRVFYLPESSTPQQLNEIVNVLRTVFDIRFITQQPASSTVTARAPQALLDAATRFLEQFDNASPEILLEMTVYEVNRDAMLNFGLDIPLQFQTFNIPASAIAALGQSNIQDLINQLISSGGINQANTQAISALLAQLQSQQNSLFSQPVATFGGGSTLFGIPVSPAKASFSWHDSHISRLDQVTLRASEGNPATMRIGTRYPILNATFAPIFNSASISQVIGSQSFAAPFPSFNYEDLGVNVKATPAVQGHLVSLKLELEIRALGPQSFNGIPVIVNRSYQTSIAVNDGESAVVTGLLSKSDTKSLHGIPGIAQLPGLSYLFANPNTEHSEGEILVVITPHVVRGGPTASSEIFLPGS